MFEQLQIENGATGSGDWALRASVNVGVNRQVGTVTSEVGDASTVRCEFYRGTCGLPCTVDSGTGRIILSVGSVAGVTMPAHLGEALWVRPPSRGDLPLATVVIDALVLAHRGATGRSK
ncbi:hypothetical protein [Nocardia cyriacigeorgica]|uniref:hypothetical protein n=1 Tax=Nocardia cyriacigeorgica TaxID=135487 RepID=UPI0013D4EDBD|nr:hypothetical protein [Nocardia cyriacigeorgica]NEW29264.1 hypothetical protein [Nocardia cyriacigeorgica]